MIWQDGFLLAVSLFFFLGFFWFGWVKIEINKIGHWNTKVVSILEPWLEAICLYLFDWFPAFSNDIRFLQFFFAPEISIVEKVSNEDFFLKGKPFF